MEMNVAIAICTITYQSALDHSDYRTPYHCNDYFVVV